MNVIRPNDENAQTVNTKERGRWHTGRLHQCESDCSGSTEVPQLQFPISKPRFKASKPSSMLPKSWFMEDVDRRASHTARIEFAQEEIIRTSVGRRTRRASDVL
ncbi:hypothetical protein PISMIDRAFT_690243 [Pisolithus microcarpus 441]|uniref:Uncharacterized protein n=1 Tax=Pisolithus microcarpus 441 TaxID=765257 RepID=A0A0C9YUQ4_9AGAM|nr:hypothetical protein BKA83DRAFT_690243 [Pisolithus microcarpus]KIK11583.1 hypothetical protein PISMIDRAFT_690243 [Pisolithus microcarpus 441]